ERRPDDFMVVLRSVGEIEKELGLRGDLHASGFEEDPPDHFSEARRAGLARANAIAPAAREVVGEQFQLRAFARAIAALERDETNHDIKNIEVSGENPGDYSRPRGGSLRPNAGTRASFRPG